MPMTRFSAAELGGGWQARPAARDSFSTARPLAAKKRTCEWYWGESSSLFQVFVRPDR